ncbi:MAG: hypothetical protein K6E40_11890 [Desulfovibrio sp.]|nr:hypothetical protein [Desulfovibrio sp.]
MLPSAWPFPWQRARRRHRIITTAGRRRHRITIMRLRLPMSLRRAMLRRHRAMRLRHAMRLPALIPDLATITATALIASLS